MLPIYINNSEVKVFAREILSSIIKDYFLVNTDSEDDFSGLFPEVIYNEKKEKCDSAATDINIWSRDGFERDLSPLHEHALLNILLWAGDIEEDYFNENGGSLYFENVPNYGYSVAEEDESSEYSISDIDMSFYLDNCFQDLDFLRFHDYINLTENTSISFVESKFHLELNHYRDLIPRDIESKLFVTDSQDINASLNTIKIILQGSEEVNIMPQKNLNIIASSFGDNVNIFGDNVQQNKTVKNNDSFDKTFEELFKIISNSTISIEGKQQAIYHAQELQNAIQTRDKGKAKSLHSFLLNSLGSISSLLTIGKFISEKL